MGRAEMLTEARDQVEAASKTAVRPEGRDGFLDPFYAPQQRKVAEARAPQGTDAAATAGPRATLIASGQRSSYSPSRMRASADPRRPHTALNEAQRDAELHVPAIVEAHVKHPPNVPRPASNCQNAKNGLACDSAEGGGTSSGGTGAEPLLRGHC
jgi:hypothetical protein